MTGTLTPTGLAALVPDGPPDTPETRVGVSVSRTLPFQITLTFTASGGCREISGTARDATDWWSDIRPEDLPACGPFLAARAQLAAHDAQAEERRRALRGELADAQAERRFAEEDLVTPGLGARLDAIDSRIESLRSRLEGIDGTRAKLVTLAERHRPAASEAVRAVASERFEARRRDVGRRLAAALDRLAADAKDAVLQVLGLARAGESLREATAAAEVRNTAQVLLG